MIRGSTGSRSRRHPRWREQHEQGWKHACRLFLWEPRQFVAPGGEWQSCCSTHEAAKGSKIAFAGDSELGKELSFYPLNQRLSHSQVINPWNFSLSPWLGFPSLQAFQGCPPTALRVLPTSLSLENIYPHPKHLGHGGRWTSVIKRCLLPPCMGFGQIANLSELWSSLSN